MPMGGLFNRCQPELSPEQHDEHVQNSASGRDADSRQAESHRLGGLRGGPLIAGEDRDA